MTVVLLQPSGVADEAPVAALRRRELRLVCWEGAATAGIEAVELARPPAFFARFEAVLSRGPLGRTIVRLTSADRGALFWRAVSRDPRMREIARGAELVVAGERDAIYAAWRMRQDRTWEVAAAVNGIAAANERTAA